MYRTETSTREVNGLQFITVFVMLYQVQTFKTEWHVKIMNKEVDGKWRKWSQTISSSVIFRMGFMNADFLLI